nr:hypothetical protein [uncultured Butyricicoccus sp.]
MSQSEMGFRTAAFGFRREDVLDFIEEEADRRSALQEKLHKVQTERDNLIQEKEEADHAAQALIADRDRILSEQQAKDQTITSLQAQVRIAQDASEQAQEELNALRTKVDEMQKELDNVRADNASLLSKCAEYDEARARLAEIELCAHGRAEEIQQRAADDACSLVEEAQQMAVRLLDAIEHTKESYRQALAAAERESERAHVHAVESLEKLDVIMDGLRGRLSQVQEQPAANESAQLAVPVLETQVLPAAQKSAAAEKPRSSGCPAREKPTLAQLLHTLRGNK